MSLAKRLWPLKRLVRRIYPVRVPQPQWQEALGPDWPRWQEALQSLAPDAPRLLLVPTASHPVITTLDSLLAVALTLRGARVEFLLCGESLPACQAATLQHMPNEREFLTHGAKRALCSTCFSPGAAMLRGLGFPVRRLGDFLTAEEEGEAARIAASVSTQEIPGYQVGGVAVGEHALAGAIRFFARGTIDQEPYGDQVLRRYLRAGLVANYAAQRLFQQRPFRAVSLHHGLYVPQGIISAAARVRGVRVVNWAMGYRKRAFIFSHGDTYHKTMLTEPTADWENMDWTPEVESELVAYLKDRWSGAQDWISYNPNGETRQDLISKQIGVDLAKPCIGLLTNVMWDAQLFYSYSAFENMMEWLKATIAYFQTRPDLQLLIRVHPAELQAQIKSRQPVMAEIHQAFPILPKNVFIIPPESQISTYAAMMECDSVLIYGTKTGVELTSFGVPVIVAGEAWVRNKGVAIDARSREHYLEILASLPIGERLTAEQVRRARRYAYHYFFRRMIPLEVVKSEPPGGWSPYSLNVTSLDQLAPGGDKGLEVICAGILEGSDFTYAAERLARSDHAA